MLHGFPVKNPRLRTIVVMDTWSCRPDVSRGWGLSLAYDYLDVKDKRFWRRGLTARVDGSTLITYGDIEARIDRSRVLQGKLLSTPQRPTSWLCSCNPARASGTSRSREAIYGERLSAKESLSRLQDSLSGPCAAKLRTAGPRGHRQPGSRGYVLRIQSFTTDFERVGLYCKSVRSGEFQEFSFFIFTLST